MLNVTIDTASKKASVTFSCDIDMENALRTEQLLFLDAVKDGARFMRFRQDDRANAQAFAEANGCELVEADEGERRVVPDDEIRRHTLREAQAAFNDAVRALDLPADHAERETARLEKELADAKALLGKRPTVEMA